MTIQNLKFCTFNPMRKAALIVGGGRSSRIGGPLPKQFMELEGDPVIMHAARMFSECFPGIHLVFVIPQEYFALWDEYVHRYRFRIPHELAAGGESRFQSVKNGLSRISPDELVAVHDAARPLVSRALLERCFFDAEENGNAVPVVQPVDSLRQLAAQGNTGLGRDQIRLVQTPQVFRADQLIQAYESEEDQDCPDDATVMQRAGFEIFLTEGDRLNFKITLPEDFDMAGYLIKKRMK